MNRLVKHLNGEQYIGLYPLCPPDNPSWFIVADFDEGDWLISACKFIDACMNAGIPAYLERLRSGQGGHVWISFDKPYSATKSRRIILSLLTSSGVISAFDKNFSFDRLFPNQDYLSGECLGNLIALPLNGTCLKQDNSCFLNLTSLRPYADQWQFPEQIKRTSVEHLE